MNFWTLNSRFSTFLKVFYFFGVNNSLADWCKLSTYFQIWESYRIHSVVSTIWELKNADWTGAEIKKNQQTHTYMQL